MNCPIHSKLTLLRAGFAFYPSLSPTAKFSLAEGMFAVCDELQTQLANGDHSEKQYCLGYLASVKNLANDMTKREITTQELEMAATYLVKVLTCTDALPGQETY